MSVLELSSVITPDGKDKSGDYFTQRNVNDAVAKMINTNCYFKNKGKTMSIDYDNAREIIEKAQSQYDDAISRLHTSEKQIADRAKIVSANIRKTTTTLSQGLAKIEKQANFDRLEVYVALLERAESAMTSLAELEKSGKLEKIADALS